MMYETLYEYLVLHKELSVPGVGTFVVHRNSPVIDFPDKKINPPAYYISLQFPAAAPSVSFFSWLGKALHISDREAVIHFNDFAFDLKKQISGGSSIEWNGIGLLSKGLSGDVKLTPPGEIILEKPVAAQKVIRENAEHSVRVGEEEKTSVQMTELLGKREMENRSNWWALALVTGFIILVFMGWYFSKNGISVSSTGNTLRTTPAETGSTYQLIP